MITKMTLTITADTDQISPVVAPKALAETLALLAQVVDLPATKYVLTFECLEGAAGQYLDDIKSALLGRPAGIDAGLKIQTEHQLERKKIAPVIPMDRHWGASPAEQIGQAIEALRPRAGSGVTAVELSAGGHTLRLEPEPEL